MSTWRVYDDLGTMHIGSLPGCKGKLTGWLKSDTAKELYFEDELFGARQDVIAFDGEGGKLEVLGFTIEEVAADDVN
jgi:hypothetical protein